MANVNPGRRAQSALTAFFFLTTLVLAFLLAREQGQIETRHIFVTESSPDQPLNAIKHDPPTSFGNRITVSDYQAGLELYDPARIWGLLVHTGGTPLQSHWSIYFRRDQAELVCRQADEAQKDKFLTPTMKEDWTNFCFEARSIAFLGDPTDRLCADYCPEYWGSFWPMSFYPPALGPD